jgi:hypothetical protein
VDGVFIVVSGVLTLVLAPERLPAMLNLVAVAQPLVLALVLYFALDRAIAQVRAELARLLAAMGAQQH